MAEATAPGKLLLTGEYAVLEGAPAVALALGGPARARVDPAVAGEFRASPEGEAWPFSFGQGTGVHWHAGDPGDSGRLPAAVLAECLRRWPAALQSQPLAIELDTSAFRARDTGGLEQKFGLGSSAAVVVALVGALTAALHIDVSGAAIRDCCLAAHRAFQGGQGSGVDILTALQGGLLLAESPAAAPVALPWPPDLFLVPVWTGASASTPALIGRFDEFRTRAPQLFADCLARLVAAAVDAAKAWRSARSRQILIAVEAYAHALRTLDEHGQIGIWTPAHQSLAALAAESGAIYKSSGAGGGDLGYAISASNKVAQALATRMRADGFHVLSTETALLPGLAVTPAASGPRVHCT